MQRLSDNDSMQNAVKTPNYLHTNMQMAIQMSGHMCREDDRSVYASIQTPTTVQTYNTHILAWWQAGRLFGQIPGL